MIPSRSLADSTTRPGDGGTAPAAGPEFVDGDLLRLVPALEPAERERFRGIRRFLQEQVRPRSVPHWERDEFAPELVALMAPYGLGRLQLDGSSRLFKGLVHAELARADASLSALVGIHNELIVGMLDRLGSQRHKREWLPRLTTFDALGAFALTEPEHGSDIKGGLSTTARREGDEWVLDGAKRWIGLGTIAQLALVWARDVADGAVKGFLVETDRPGYTATKITGKTGLRIMQNADITLRGVRIPADNLLPGATGFARANDLLRDSRAWVGWQAAGLQLAAFDVARDYALQRRQFGRPLANFQLTQDGLAELIGNATASLALMTQIARLQEEGDMAMAQAALVKATTTRLARSSVAIARNALGGNGICAGYEAAKIFNDAEAVYTYEGSYQINQLIVGRAVTGVSAFV